MNSSSRLTWWVILVTACLNMTPSEAQDSTPPRGAYAAKPGDFVAYRFHSSLARMGGDPEPHARVTGTLRLEVLAVEGDELELGVRVTSYSREERVGAAPWKVAAN